MSADLIDPQNIPQFTGDLEQLGTDSMLLTAEALTFRQSGSDVHTRFQGLSACYSAPEADQLFATTAPVAAKADEFADDLEKVAAALSSYETEVQPLVAKLKSLKQRAETFRHDIAGDDHWREDDDNVQLNNDLVHDVTAATTAFWQAEITCHNKITALVGGTTLILEDGAQKRLVKRGTSTYGFTADLLNQSEELPWGKTVEKERHGLDWLGHQVIDFGKGFFVDGVWGTIRGLGTFVGFDGWDAAGEAWTGLGKLATGLAITVTPIAGSLYWTMPEDKLPGYLRETRNTVKEAGMALVAWDEWGKNPARAGGAVTFNVLTTIFTGGAGTAAKGGAVARTLAVLGKTGRLVDPMTYLGKAAKFGTVKVADLFAGLKDLHAGAFNDLISGAGRVQPDGSVLRIADDLPVIHDNVLQWPDGTRLNLDDSSVVRPDGTAAPATVELSAADRDLLRQTLPHREPVMTSSGGHATGTAYGAGESHPGTHAAHDGSAASEHHPPSASQPSSGGNGHGPAGSEHHTPQHGGPGGGKPSDVPAGQEPLHHRANDPLPELTPEERADHWGHLKEVEGRSPDQFDDLQRDPDKNGGISEPSKDEARVGLDLREQGRLPDDIQRPTEADRGEFYSPSADRYYDIKGVHSDWPPFNNVRDKSQPFKGAYDPAKNGRWVKKLEEQIVEKQRVVILDVRNANQAAIDDIKSIVHKNGWEDDVIWYP
ncbi:hypothetical protein OG802_12715 [Streptomyces sp. NBC_00704]|uniref:hypothetical protein n=1 Tax=Streptomyces sp. NBC_00704 TaxID=2975809 RepID=UPI002E3308A1|nr:hypothetical protein [Streptomyces sp. NBC_00704]